jgi:hypothetical protein
MAVTAPVALSIAWPAGGRGGASREIGGAGDIVNCGPSRRAPVNAFSRPFWRLRLAPGCLVAQGTKSIARVTAFATTAVDIGFARFVLPN